MQIDGRCHCGRVTDVAEIDPTTVSVCHCTDCQVLSGCGTPIYSAAETDPTSFNLRLGAIVQRAQLTPDVQHWARSKLDWAIDIRDLPIGPNS